MIKDDERALWAALLAGEQPRTAGHRLGIHPNRVRYLCEKWARRGIYDYGVSHDLGWVERRTLYRPVQRDDGMWDHEAYVWTPELPR